ncbi:MAG: hypothetical protein KA113_07345 [Syntrophaceae bacterium]|jgi:hypothetical protein|nr:hypothetical protein [Syntrophaceae bacterium]
MQNILKRNVNVLTLFVVNCNEDKYLTTLTDFSGGSAGLFRVRTISIRRDMMVCRVWCVFMNLSPVIRFPPGLAPMLHIGKNAGMETARQGMRQDRRLIAVDCPGAILQKRLTGA